MSLPLPMPDRSFSYRVCNVRIYPGGVCRAKHQKRAKWEISLGRSITWLIIFWLCFITNILHHFVLRPSKLLLRWFAWWRWWWQWWLGCFRRRRRSFLPKIDKTIIFSIFICFKSAPSLHSFHLFKDCWRSMKHLKTIIITIADAWMVVLLMAKFKHFHSRKYFLDYSLCACVFRTNNCSSVCYFACINQ